MLPVTGCQAGRRLSAPLHGSQWLEAKWIPNRVHTIKGCHFWHGNHIGWPVHCGPLMPWRSTMPNATLEAPPASFPWTIFLLPVPCTKNYLTRQQPLCCYLPNRSPSLEKKIAAAHMFHEFQYSKITLATNVLLKVKLLNMKKHVCPWCKSTYINFNSSICARRKSFS